MAARRATPPRREAASRKRPQSTPSAIASQCLALRARVLNRALSSIYDRALAPHDLKVSQFNLLVAISAHPGVLASRLGDALCIDESTLSRNLERLRQRGWIEVEASGDPRARPLHMTAEGRVSFAAACADWERAQADALRALGPGDSEALIRIAERFLHA
ncbi:MAG: winged helix-turn-helix transcriptional regulator [Planctomycetes bacterium]|nr:winged helix-turn-helix transcriptional regulator [Planctomycetota bacterium]